MLFFVFVSPVSTQFSLLLFCSCCLICAVPAAYMLFLLLLLQALREAVSKLYSSTSPHQMVICAPEEGERISLFTAWQHSIPTPKLH
jgi:hypothetical protein